MSSGKAIENPGKLPARTALHISAGGRKFKQLTERGDDWFDWDTNMFHFFGGTPMGESMAVYDGHPIQYYIEQWKLTHGNAESLRSVVHS